MDVSKFSIDRNSYLSVAAASAGSLYDTAAKSASSNNAAAYSAYLDPSVLTKAYFDSKLYQDRNYLDISKIYTSAAHHQSQQQQQHQHQQHQSHQHHQHLHQQQQIHQQASNVFGGITALANLSSGRGGSTNSIDERESQTPQLSEGSNDIKPHMIVSGTDSEAVSGSGPLSGNYSAYQYASDANNTTTAAGSGEYRRPLTVIF